MDFEIAFFPVGEASSAGDAIVVRHADNNSHYIYVVDGGTIDSGEAIVDDLRRTYNMDDVTIAGVISTHPDRDHSSGLRVVLEKLNVKRLWMHRPWNHANKILHLFSDKRWTPEGLEKRIRESYPFVAELEEIADRKGIPISEPYTGDVIGPFTVLSPFETFYESLIPQFDNLPDADEERLKNLGAWIGKRQVVTKSLLDAVLGVLSRVAESIGFETLREGGITSATNESSVVLFANFGDQKCLLTADAGRYALSAAMVYAAVSNIDLQEINLIQIPHHGSRSNVSPSLLNKLVGTKQSAPIIFNKSAIASVPRDDGKHPRKIVLNAFYRRGAKWILTQGVPIYWYHGVWGRNLSAVKEPEFFNEVEDYD